MNNAFNAYTLDTAAQTLATYIHIAEQLYSKGYCILEQAIPQHLAAALCAQAKTYSDDYKKAEVGRGNTKHYNPAIRSDEILWISEKTAAETNWLAWAEGLRVQLNQRLFLNLSHVESHFSHYPPDAFYRKHRDAFQGNSNRLVSMVTYLNPSWCPENGGEMLLYDDNEQQILRVQPTLGTLAVFLSNDFPHEVLATQKDRYSIASWFRVNEPGNPVISRLK
ncbi:2OG-Fe(II) oxygenase [Dasania marina]|uniref:2OG-Fe(II) oxygenase n=1 Tax=Dasania marina TaxID=471499 RepID=UPI0030D89FD5|tara:strand:+ start:2898 stop:3563 length:666 start_codon:yes stop_codon:yes gene_type:complete